MLVEKTCQPCGVPCRPDRKRESRTLSVKRMHMTDSEPVRWYKELQQQRLAEDIASAAALNSIGECTCAAASLQTVSGEFFILHCGVFDEDERPPLNKGEFQGG